MKKHVYICAALCAVMLLACLAACGKGEPEVSGAEVSLPVSYEVDGMGVSICEVEQAAHNGNIVDAICFDPGMFDLKEQCGLIASGTVSNIRDICITSVSDGGYERISQRTLFEFTIEEAFQSDVDNPVGKTVTIYTHRVYSEDEPELIEGERYIIFGENLENNERDTLEMKANGIADYMLAHPTTLFISYVENTPEKLARVFEKMSDERYNASEVDADFIAEGNTYTLSDLEAYLRAKCK